MDTLLLGSLPQATVELLRRAPWIDETGRRTGQFQLVDQAALETVRLLIVAPAGDSTGRWFVPVMEQDPGRGADRTPEYDQVIVRALRAGLDLPTLRGNRIEFRGDPAEYRGQLPFDPGWSSNALSLLDLDGTPHAHKTYRRIGVGTREPELLRLMAAGGRTQQPAGDYTYVETATGRREPLGVLYRYADGEGLNVPLSAGIRAMWPLLHTGADPESAVTHSQRPLVAPLHETGRFLRDFHHELAEQLGPHPQFPVDNFLTETAARTDALRPLILEDARFPAAVRRTAVAGLDRELARVRAQSPQPWPAGPCHGDLHLSHLLRRERPDGSWELCVIDLSTPETDPADPATAQSPWQDLAALQRGLEIFTADELADHAALALGMEADDTCRTALLLAAGTDPDTPGWTPRHIAELTRLAAAARLWAARTGDLLITQGRSLADHPAWRLLRLRRLIHELDYAYAHDRAYHAAINLRHAVEAAGLPGTRAKD
ncbi:phosphotransferase [Kitasatospora purpeofusca]|uniref:phosphotransferase n=1 Tax=Kitasatospora purpeofusca TaxID=67352 RepID=UPI0004C20F17|nr:phosphotransferase [Kitasatospora purpeofusca]